MSKMILAAGAAALALATPALAQHGNGHGGGKGQEHGQGKPAKDNHGSQGQGHGKGGDARVQVKADRGNGHGPAIKFDRGNDRGGPDKVVRVGPMGHGDDGVRLPRLAGRGGMIDGCPPGLAMKDNGCLPPGQAKKIGSPLARAAATGLLGPYSQWYRDNDRYYYRMDDGILYQVNRSDGLIDALIPYGMRDYSYYPVGYNYPSLYNSYNLPYAYRSYYPDGGDYLYRYGGNAIYAVDPKTQLVSSIVSLLAGDLSVGQPLPAGYGVYNVPLAYRDRYMDSPNDWYRYNDGYIYRVDPTTRLVTAVIDALV